MSDVWYCIDESDTGDWVTSIWDGLGIPAAQIPSTGESGAAYLFNDIAGQGASTTDEFSSTILTVPPVGIFTHDEYSALSFTGAGDGVYTATYMAERNGVPYLNPGTAGGEWVITMTIGSPTPPEEIDITINAGVPTLGASASIALSSSLVVAAGVPTIDASASISLASVFTVSAGIPTMSAASVMTESNSIFCWPGYLRRQQVA